ncbi:hypothetical protein TNCT_375661 [Trichonephila clavata]|uniref:Uncharacterized protein n=1 Tax=Trichonephila clavata TaxID=2740835 RepID=A0A8X6L030_TRICU|nr:hypothetical protein TNCT_375661 [Trichonephila clavata]
MVFDVILDLTLNGRKNDLCPTAVRAITLENNNTRYPADQWLRIYTDCSLLDLYGASVLALSVIYFPFTLHIDSYTTYFDGEIESIHLVLL